MKIQHYRINSGDEVLLGEEKTATMERVAESLIKGEFGFGGRVTEATKTLLEVTTKIFHCIDRTVYIGTEEEMKTPLAIAAVWTNERDGIPVDEWVEQLDKMLGDQKGLPFMVAAFAPFAETHLVAKRILEKAGA